MSNCWSGVSMRQLFVGLGFAAFLVTGATQDVQGQTLKMSKAEQDAIKVVNAWNAAWATKDAEKIGALMAEDCVFRGDPMERQLKTGRAAFVQEVKQLLTFGDLEIEPGPAYAVGGERGIAVLQRRVDRINMNGTRMSVPLAAFFRVKDGKIEEWLDMPLINLAPPPGGFGPGGPGAPGAPGGAGAPGNRPN